MSGPTATPDPTTATVDLDAILADPGRLRVPPTPEGIEVTVRRIRTREALALLRLVSPALAALQQIDVSDVEKAAKVLSGALIGAAANEPDEFLAFVQTIVDPVDPADRNRLLVELSNPDLDTLVSVADVLVTQEAADVVGLVGKVLALAGRAKTISATSQRTAPGDPGPNPST